MRVGDVALHPIHRQPDVDRTAPPDLHHVAQPVDRSGLPHEAQVGDRICCADVIDKSAGAVKGRAFLVAGDDEADGAAFGRDVRDRRRHGSNGAFHVHGAAAEQQVATGCLPHFGRERAAGPSLTRRYDIEVAREGEVARSGRAVADGEQVLDRTVRLFPGNEAMDGKAVRLQQPCHRVEYIAQSGRDAWRCHQRLGMIEDAHDTRPARNLLLIIGIKPVRLHIEPEPSPRPRPPRSSPASTHAPKPPACTPGRSPERRCHRSGSG